MFQELNLLKKTKSENPESPAFNSGVYLPSALVMRSAWVVHRAPSNLISLFQKVTAMTKIVERDEGPVIHSISSPLCFICPFTYYCVHRGHYIKHISPRRARWYRAVNHRVRGIDHSESDLTTAVRVSGEETDQPEEPSTSEWLCRKKAILITFRKRAAFWEMCHHRTQSQMTAQIWASYQGNMNTDDVLDSEQEGGAALNLDWR